MITRSVEQGEIEFTLHSVSVLTRLCMVTQAGQPSLCLHALRGEGQGF